MADQAWLEIYREYDLAKLAAEIARLEQFSDPLAAQTAGDKSYTKESNFAGRLAAAYRAQRERKASTPKAVGVPNFNNINFGQPGGPGVPTTGQFGGVHAYLSPGSFTVTITVTDDDGGTTSTQLLVGVGSPHLTVYGTDAGGGINCSAEPEACDAP